MFPLSIFHTHRHTHLSMQCIHVCLDAMINACWYNHYLPSPCKTMKYLGELAKRKTHLLCSKCKVFLFLKFGQLRSEPKQLTHLSLSYKPSFSFMLTAWVIFHLYLSCPWLQILVSIVNKQDFSISRFVMFSLSLSLALSISLSHTHTQSIPIQNNTPKTFYQNLWSLAEACVTFVYLIILVNKDLSLSLRRFHFSIFICRAYNLISTAAASCVAARTRMMRAWSTCCQCRQACWCLLGCSTGTIRLLFAFAGVLVDVERTDEGRCSKTDRWERWSP